MTSKYQHKFDRGFTLVEMLVVIAIIGVLMSFSLPAIQSAREAGRRAECQMNLVNLTLAIGTYHDRWTHYPVGAAGPSPGPEPSPIPGPGHSWLGRIADLLDAPVVARRIDWDAEPLAPQNAAVATLRFAPAVCPTGDRMLHAASGYAGLHGPTEQPLGPGGRGMFLVDQTVRADEVTDGLSATIFVAEKQSYRDDAGWLVGSRATIRNGSSIDSIQPVPPAPPADGLVGPIGSQHPGGVMVGFGSAEVRFISTQTDLRLLAQWTDRADGGLPLDWQPIVPPAVAAVRQAAERRLPVAAARQAAERRLSVAAVRQAAERRLPVAAARQAAERRLSVAAARQAAEPPLSRFGVLTQRRYVR